MVDVIQKLSVPYILNEPGITFCLVLQFPRITDPLFDILGIMGYLLDSTHPHRWTVCQYNVF